MLSHTVSMERSLFNSLNNVYLNFTAIICKIIIVNFEKHMITSVRKSNLFKNQNIHGRYLKR